MIKQNTDIFENEIKTSAKEGRIVKPSSGTSTEMRNQNELLPIERTVIESLEIDLQSDIDESYCIQYVKLNSVGKIAKDWNTSSEKVKKALINHNLIIPDEKDWAKIVELIKGVNCDIPLSDYIQEIMPALLLGSTSLRMMEKSDPELELDFGEYSQPLKFLRLLIHSKIEKIDDGLTQKFNKAIKFLLNYPTASVVFSQGSNNSKWMDYIHALFIEDGYTITPHSSSNVAGPLQSFDTSKSFQLFDLYAKWYHYDKKTVAFDIEITPTMLLIWYIEKGSLTKDSFNIETHLCSQKETNFLCEQLCLALGLECHTSRTEDGYMIAISLKKDNVTKFFNYLDTANPTVIALAKETFPRKFDYNLGFESNNEED